MRPTARRTGSASLVAAFPPLATKNAAVPRMRTTSHWWVIMIGLLDVNGALIHL